MKKVLTSLFIIQAVGSLFAQSAFIKGRISDAKTKETIVGAAIVLDDSTGTTSDINGDYLVKTRPGKHKTEFKYIGYKTQTKILDLKENDTIRLNAVLEQDSKQLDIVVISAGKFEQNLNEVTVSMEVIKPQLIENKALTSIDKAVDQVPGVNVIDGQANIRGGSGFSYGAGSRVLLLVDEMPMVTADAGDVKWSFLPIENCEQIEVIKGASSALFGSSAMNGVINFRTAYAKDEPETKINFYGGMYAKPERKELAFFWKDGNPIYSGMNFYHAQKLGNLDLVLGGNLYDDRGYRYLGTEQRYRFNTNLRYRFKKIPGLAVGVNLNTLRGTGGLFLLWAGADSAFYPSGGDVSHYTSLRTNVDPFVIYNTKNGGRHTLRSRYFSTTNLNNTNQESTADVYYAEYQFQKHFENGLTWTSGTVYNYNTVHSGALYGIHFSKNASLFTQLDKKFDRLTLSFGIRGEYFKTDTVELQEDIKLLGNSIVKNSKVKPVVRAGVNYRLMEATFMRASFGQGFRFPSIAERFIKTSASGIDVYPNDSLKPESGWSSEIGIKQGIKLGEWKGYLDVAAFWTEYRNMMEFTFGKYGNSTVYPYGLGFQSQNIGNTRIRGFELSLMGFGKMGPIDVSTLLGYTYIDPHQTDFDVVKDTAFNTSKTDLLKYRFQHTGKADVELGYKKVSTGMSMRANSFMGNIDAFFVGFFPGVGQYRAEHNKGDAIFDYRLSYQMNKTAKIAFVVNNVFNREVMGRPMDIQPPRVFVLQLTIKL